MKKLFLSLAALVMTMSALVMTSCSSESLDEVAPEVVTPETGTHVETLTIAFPEQAETRVGVDSDNKLTGWEEGDEVTLVRKNYQTINGELGSDYIYAFRCTNAEEGIFTGTLPNGTSVNDCQFAFYNATGFASNGIMDCFFSPKTRASRNMKDVIMLVAENDGEGNFEMQIFGSILQVAYIGSKDIKASVKFKWRDDVKYYDKNRIYYNAFRTACFETYIGDGVGIGVDHPITLWKNATTYVYIPVFNNDGGSLYYSVGLSAEDDESEECSIVRFKNNPDNAKLYKIAFGEPVAWENPLTLGKSTATSIAIETGVNVISYTADGTHKPLNASGTIWEVLDGSVLRIQALSSRIKGHNTMQLKDKAEGLFASYVAVETITGLDKLDMSEVTDMSYMFAHCNALQTLDLSSWDTSSVTDMGSMFSNCDALQTLDLSSWDTSSVTDMGSMFAYCDALQTIDLSSWNTSKVKCMNSMFSDCNALQTLNINGWDTSSVTDMRLMFTNCKAIQTLDLSSWNTSNVTNMSYMFTTCLKLKSLYLSNNFVINPGTDIRNMFVCCGMEVTDKGVIYGASSSVQNMITSDEYTSFESMRFSTAR